MVSVTPLLDKTACNGTVWDDASGGQKVTAASAPGAHPLLVQSQDVGVGRQCGALADLAEYVDERGELLRELVEHFAERLVAARQRSVCALPQLNVVVDVHESSIEAVGEEAGDEKRKIADLAKAVALSDTRGLHRAREPYTERPVISRRR